MGELCIVSFRVGIACVRIGGWMGTYGRAVYACSNEYIGIVTGYDL